MQYIRERISAVIFPELLCDLVADSSYSGNKGAVIVGRDGLDGRDNIRCLSYTAKLIILESDTQTETGIKRTVTGRNDHRVRRVCRSFRRGQGNKLVFIVEIDTLYIHAGSRIVGVAEDIRAAAVLPDTGREHKVRGNGFGDAATEKCTAQTDIRTVRSVNITIGGIEAVPNTLSPMELIIGITPEHELLQLTAYGVGDGDHITGSRDRGLLHAVDLRIHTEQLGELHVKRDRIHLNDTVIDHRGQETINRGRFSTNVGKAIINGGIEIVNVVDHGVFKVPDAFDSKLDIIHEQDLIVRDQDVQLRDDGKKVQIRCYIDEPVCIIRVRGCGNVNMNILLRLFSSVDFTIRITHSAYEKSKSHSSLIIHSNHVNFGTGIVIQGA